MATLGPPVETTPLIQAPYSQTHAALSPNGRFLSYASNETGRPKVYVRPYPSVDQGRWQISVEGGVEPRWSADGRELFFSNFGEGLRPAEPAILSVAVQPGSAFAAG
jgi:serine/threonine-protein kinase